VLSWEFTGSLGCPLFLGEQEMKKKPMPNQPDKREVRGKVQAAVAAKAEGSSFVVKNQAPDAAASTVPTHFCKIKIGR
jgi:hypothetical protein